MRHNSTAILWKNGNALTYTVAATFALPLLAALVVPGTLLTAVCFTVPFIGTAYLCGKNLGTASEPVEVEGTVLSGSRCV
jgi:hypothetical protein